VDRVLTVLNVLIGVIIFIIAILMFLNSYGTDEILGIDLVDLFIALIICIFLLAIGRLVARGIRWLLGFLEEVNRHTTKD
jgi:phosphoglycerol transferase MdoB-like AlkP superfamily enzyme